MTFGDNMGWIRQKLMTIYDRVLCDYWETRFISQLSAILRFHEVSPMWDEIGNSWLPVVMLFRTRGELTLGWE